MVCSRTGALPFGLIRAGMTRACACTMNSSPSRRMPLASPFKVGYFNPHGWLGYVYYDVMFVKRFGVRRDEEYPDFGCNAEVYVNARALELESLGPFVELAPQVDVVHTETWEVYEANKFPHYCVENRWMKFDS